MNREDLSSIVGSYHCVHGTGILTGLNTMLTATMVSAAFPTNALERLDQTQRWSSAEVPRVGNVEDWARNT